LVLKAHVFANYRRYIFGWPSSPAFSYRPLDTGGHDSIPSRSVRNFWCTGWKWWYTLPMPPYSFNFYRKVKR